MAQSQSSWEKYHFVAALLGGVLIPIAVFVAGLIVSNAETRSAKLAAHAENLTSLIGPLASTNTKELAIAVQVARHLASQDRLPPELTGSLLSIAENSELAEISRDASAAALGAARTDAFSEQMTSRAFSSEIPPRVYFHISSETQRRQAEALDVGLESKLSALDLVVPGVELKPGPPVSELRYFKASESSEAEIIGDALVALGVGVKVVDLSARYADSTGIRPRHYELWLAPPSRN